MNEANRLTGLYFYKIDQKDANINWRKKIHGIISKMLDNGISASTIESAMNKDAEHFEDIVKNASHAKAAPTQDNLVKQDTFYYHPFLQMAPPAPVITINEDGTFSESYSDEQFFLRIKTTFTFEDIIKYYYTRFELPQGNLKRDLGSIKYLYQNEIAPALMNDDTGMNELDLLLFTVDAAYNVIKGDTTKQINYNGILGLSNYVEEGLYLYREKLNYCKLNELTHTY